MSASWLDSVRERAASGGDLVSVIVASAEGSAPREPGAWMLVDRDGQAGTVGGGRLEWKRPDRPAMLARPRRSVAAHLRDYPLGRTWNKCSADSCGLFFETDRRCGTGAAAG